MTGTMNETLLSCPFCGEMPMSYSVRNGTVRVVCEDCGVDGPFVEGSAENEETWVKATDAWNRRAQPLQEKHELACVSETTKSDTQEGLHIADGTQPAQETPKSMHVEGDVHREVVITDAMVDLAMDKYRWCVREYEADFNRLDRSDEGFWERKYGTNLHSTGLGERRAMRAALKAALSGK